ncbi:DNA primase [Myxococcus phage Mx1]|nr:DNA primase [Myxococcus phage Mx1]
MALDPVALARFIRDTGIEYREGGQSYKFECPRCRKPDKLYIRKRDGRFICFSCAGTSNFKGRAEYALFELTRTPMQEIRRCIYGADTGDDPNYLDVQLVDFWDEDEDSFSLDAALPVQEVVWPPDYFGPDQGKVFVKGARYLHQRGLRLEHVQTYDIRYSPIDKRVVFPVKVDGQLVGWQARYIDKTEVWNEETQRFFKIPKIITSDSLRNVGGRYLMFQDRIVGSPHAVLAEGPVSAIKAHLCGGNVATMGKNVSLHQLETVARHCRKLYVALDPDAGEEIMRLVWSWYDRFDELYLLTPPFNYDYLDAPENEKDLGDMSEDEVYEAFLSARPERRGKLYISLGGVLIN